MKVWTQLAEMFSKAWYRENGESPPNLWQQAIWKLTDAQVMTGLANLGNDDLKFPPNLSQFIAACKKTKPVRLLGVKLLPLTQTDRDKNQKRWEADMKELVGPERWAELKK